MRQLSDSPRPAMLKLIAGKLFNPYTLQFSEDQVIVVNEDSGIITDVQSLANARKKYQLDIADPSVVDLRHLTVLPGFVDTHVHFFLHPYSEVSWEDQLTKETLVERTIRASLHAKRTLMAGFTAVRDLGTEGAGDADVAFRKCISGPNALIPGPRYFCATRAIACTGSYGPKSAIYVNREGIDGITGAEIADGKEDCIKAVRRQIGAGADFIKIYADYRFRSRLDHVSPITSADSIGTFNSEELKAMIDTAHRCGVKVAAHATNKSTIAELLRHGVDSIEHGFDVGTVDPDSNEPPPTEPLRSFAKSKAKWVPTLAVYYTSGGQNWEKGIESFKAALGINMDNIACGGDTGVFPHGENALEMTLMVKLGADWKKVLRWATLGGWECLRSMKWEGKQGETRLAKVEDLKEDVRKVGENDVPFGVVRKGFVADIIATSGDFERNFADAVKADSIRFVMKGGKIYKRDGRELV